MCNLLILLVVFIIIWIVLLRLDLFIDYSLDNQITVWYTNIFTLTRKFIIFK